MWRLRARRVREHARMRAREYAIGSECQRLLTVGKWACGGAQELLEGRVRLEGIGEVLGALRTDFVVVETASEGAFRVSAAIDSGNRVRRTRAR